MNKPNKQANKKECICENWQFINMSGKAISKIIRDTNFNCPIHNEPTEKVERIEKLDEIISLLEDIRSGIDNINEYGIKEKYY